MASKKDMRRADLGNPTLTSLSVQKLTRTSPAIPYVDPPKSSSDADISSTRILKGPIIMRQGAKAD